MGIRKLNLGIILIVVVTGLNLIENGPVDALSEGMANVRSSVVPVIKTVGDYVAKLGDGPFWDGPNGDLYFVDANVGDFVKLNVATKEVVKISVGTAVSIIIPYSDHRDTFVVSQKNQLWSLNWTDHSQTLLGSLSGAREKFNDGKCDPRGRLFIGSIVSNLIGIPVVGGGSLYRLDGGELVQVAHGFSIANGLAWSNDPTHSKFYINDTEGRKIYVFDYDIETGTPSNPRVLVDMSQNEDFGALEFPDGMAIDEFGFMWVCMYDGARIVKIDVDTGRVVDEIKLTTAGVPTSLARGSYEGRDGYFVTTGQPLIGHKPDDGKILHVSFQGAQVNSFVPQPT